ncbi:zinc transporter [Actinomyces viscosus]|uniref:zinc transporter n=2 Tax=Actinomyces viscosus TaxID=1656 RepID=UPI0038B8B48A
MRCLLTMTLISSLALLPATSARSEPHPDTPTIGGKNSGDRTGFTGEASESVELPGSEPGGVPSQDRPAVTASDPSMWEEQPHEDCVSNGGHIPDIDCMRNLMRYPSQPQEPADGGGGPRTITVTTRQAATLIAQGSGITRQPPGPRVIISKAFIVYTDPSPRYQTTTILNTPIDVEFTPTSYTWDWGDGTTLTTTDPGHPYPHQSVTHYYQHTATAVTTTLTTTWTTRYRPQGETTWRTIDGTITTTETSTPYDLVRIVTYLTDDAEEAQGH